MQTSKKLFTLLFLMALLVSACGGAATEAVRAAMFDRLRVLKPAASISRCASPTDQQQIGQTGTSKTTSTFSALRLAMIGGILARSISSARGR